MNIIDIPITLPIIATERDCAGVIPITRAEKTATASTTPKPDGVIAINIVREPIEARNNASMNEIEIPKTL